MGQFITPLHLKRPINDKNYFINDKDFVFVSREFKKKITVLPGYKTDGNSTPWYFYFISTPFARDAESALIHDVLFSCQLLPFHMSNKIFLDCMTTRGISYWRRMLKFKAVDMFGEGFWKAIPQSHINKAKQFVRIDAL